MAAHRDNPLRVRDELRTALNLRVEKITNPTDGVGEEGENECLAFLRFVDCFGRFMGCLCRDLSQCLDQGSQLRVPIRADRGRGGGQSRENIAVPPDHRAQPVHVVA